MLEDLELEARGLTVVRLGESLELPDPATMDHRVVVQILDGDWAALLGTMPMPASMPRWQAELLVESWRKANGLPTGLEARRLFYYLSRYRDQLEADFAEQYPGVDLFALWQNRQWRRLLNLIDQLRRPSRYYEAVSLDGDHLAQIEAARDGAERPKGPRMSEYGPTEERLDRIIDALTMNTQAVIAAAGGKPPRVEPQPRPETAWDSVRHRSRQAQHDALVGRVLRSRRRPD